MLCFQLFETRNMSIIEFELIFVPNAIHFPEDELVGLLGFNEQNICNSVKVNNDELVEEDNDELDEENNEEDNIELVEENNEEDNAELVEEINVSSVDENGESEYENNDHCQLDNDEATVVVSSDEETTLTRVARYCQNHHWAPNPNGTISLEDGQVIGNVKFTREIIKRYAIQEGYTLKKIKNNKYMYTVTCKNDACDWRLHVSCLTYKVTFMIKSVRGSHLMCLRVAENKETTSKYVASIFGNFIRSNPTSKMILFKIELQERFAVRVDSQTIYKAKRIVLETLKIRHDEAYAKLKKYGNAIRSMNPGTDVKVTMNLHVNRSNDYSEALHFDESEMDRYQKVEKPKSETVISENELRITAQGRLRNYISYAISLLQDKGADEIILKATGRAINKTVMIAELLKRRVVGLHQNTSTGSIDITDVWEPLEEGLLPLETTRHVSVITIILSKKELDSSSLGYQPPIPADQVKPLVEYDGETLPGMQVRGRRDQGQGRSGGNNNGVEYNNGHWDGGRGYGGRGRGQGRGRGSRGRGRGYGGRNMQQESGYYNGYGGSGSFPAQGRGRGRGRGRARGRGQGFRSDGPVGGQGFRSDEPIETAA
ncbi:hypothetical protein QYF36_007022 [Acer negundo]|nr:hypothetical protein QYF36_007022 [Acer negundo]